MISDFEDQKKKLVYLGIAVLVVMGLTLAYSFVTKKGDASEGVIDEEAPIFLDVQREQIELFTSAYMNADPLFHQRTKVKPENLSDDVKRYISLFMIREFKEFKESSFMSDGNGCNKLVFDVEEYENIIKNYFGKEGAPSRISQSLDIHTMANYPEVQFTYTKDGKIEIQGNYLCFKETSLIPPSRYMILSTEYQQDKDIITANVRYYYRQKQLQSQNYTSYNYKLKSNGSTNLFTLTMNQANYPKGITEEQENIEKYHNRLNGLSFKFKLRNDAYVELVSVETLEPEI